MNNRVVIVSTGTANVASMIAGLRRAGADSERTVDPVRVATADRVVVPGVGTFAAAMKHLRTSGMDEALRERMSAGRPVLAVCLGLQLLGTASEESPGERGLGIVGGRIIRLPPGARVPQLGWNEVAADGPGLVTRGHAYFANSYCLDRCDASWRVVYANHGGPFIAALERDAQLACQFHPELSGAWGVQLLTRWMAAC